MAGIINPQAYGQQSVAAQWMQSKAAGARGGKRSAAKRRRKAKSTRAAAKPRNRKRTAKSGKFKKGSPAARAHMAKLRKMRRKK